MKTYTLLLLVLLGSGMALSAQVATGTITGVVEDPTGAVVAGASVTATHQATQERRKVTANERGEFNIPFARIGEWSVTAEMSGFTPSTIPGIGLRVDQTVSLTLKVSSRRFTNKAPSEPLSTLAL
jgi:hypothetical protein